MGTLLAKAHGAFSARMASVLPRRVCFLYWSSYACLQGRSTVKRHSRVLSLSRSAAQISCASLIQSISS